jgi:hypothetical protein
MISAPRHSDRRHVQQRQQRRQIGLAGSCRPMRNTNKKRPGSTSIGTLSMGDNVLRECHRGLHIQAWSGPLRSRLCTTSSRSSTEADGLCGGIVVAEAEKASAPRSFLFRRAKAAKEFSSCGCEHFPFQSSADYWVVNSEDSILWTSRGATSGARERAGIGNPEKGAAGGGLLPHGIRMQERTGLEDGFIVTCLTLCN